MDSVEQNEILDIYYEKIDSIYNIYEMFKIYYGEENVCIEGCDIKNEIESRINEDNSFKDLNYDYKKRILISIIESTLNPVIKIRWPNVKISNEKGNSINIYDLFCIITMNYMGRLMSIRFLKTTYTEVQAYRGYIHSHIRQIPSYVYEDNYNNIVEKFGALNSFCFGRGPINDTIWTLSNPTNYDDIDKIYMLLCRQLDICVRIESLAGGPYIRMSSVLRYDDVYKYEPVPKQSMPKWLVEMVEKFIQYIFENANFKYSYKNDRYEISESFDDFTIHITKMFIEFAKNNDCIKSMAKKNIKQCFSNVVKTNGHLYKISGRDNYNENFHRKNDIINKKNIQLIKFKDKDFCLKIIEDNKNESESVNMIVLNNMISSYVYDVITIIINSNINLKDGNVESNKREETESSDEKKHIGIKV